MDEHVMPWIRFDNSQLHNHSHPNYGEVAAGTQKHLVAEHIYNSKLFKLLNELE